MEESGLLQVGRGSEEPPLMRRHKEEQGRAQGLGLRASAAEGMGSIPGWGTEILHDTLTLTLTHTPKGQGRKE